jgi:CubicO group peptidase (beta-lactamase class C family)
MNIKRMSHATEIIAVLCVVSVVMAGCVSIPATVAPAEAPTVAAIPTPAPTSTPSTAPTAASSAAAGAYCPTAGWRISTPEEQGMDSGELAEMLAVIREKKMDIHSLLIIRNGYLVNESYFGGYDANRKNNMQSVGRSFTGTLIGIALDKGYIDGTDHRVLDYFPERTFANLDEQKKAITMEDVLTMRSGLEWREGSGDLEETMQSKDWPQSLLDRPVVAPPGSTWNYCSGCSHILSAILQKVTGMNTQDFAEQYLFKPLGIFAGKWMTDPAGLAFGAGGFNLTARDMAKLGYLYLRNGQWDGQQIVSVDWVKRATQRYASVDEHFGYGYHWFTVTSLGGHTGYAALGGGGQIILVIPDLDLVIVTTANTEESIFELIEQYVIPAAQKPG